MMYPPVLIGDRPFKKKTPNLLISLHIPVLCDKVIEAANLLIRIVLVQPRFKEREGNIALLPKGSWKDHKINLEGSTQVSLSFADNCTNTLWKSRNYRTQIKRKTPNL